MLGRVLVAAGLLASVAGCGSGPVEAPVPRPAASAAALCRTLHDRLPHKVYRLGPRKTSPTSPLVTAWGSPAVVLRCGVPRPAQLQPTSQLAVIDTVAWLPVPPTRPVTFTAVGRAVYVEVTVPADYSPPGNVLVELSGPIKATIPETKDGTV